MGRANAGDNAASADNQQERSFLYTGKEILRDHTPDVAISPIAMKIWSDLHGDMQRPTEMIGPLRGDLKE